MTADDIQISAQTRTAAELFGSPVCYQTPNFQRPYVWKQPQIDELWQDLVDRPGHPEGEPPTRSQHFTGVILLRNPANTDDISQPEIVDGQQRLTTLQLALAALREVYDERNCHKEAEEIFALYLTNRYGVPENEPELAFKIRHSNRTDGETFRRCIRHGAKADFPLATGQNLRLDQTDQPDQEPEPGTEIISQAYRRLLELIRRDLRSKPELDQARRSILQRATMGQINAAADANTVYIIFSRINAAGTQLNPPDQVKAETFRQISNLNTDRRPIAEADWIYDRDAFWRTETGTAGSRRSHLGHLLHYWLGIRTGQFVVAARDDEDEPLLQHYRAVTDGASIEAVLHSLKQYAKNYRRLTERQDDRHPDFVRDFHIAGYSTAYPLALYCLTELAPEARPQALADVGSYLVRLALTNARSSSLNRLIIQIVKQVNDRIQRTGSQMPAAAQAVFVRETLLHISTAQRWPEDETVIRQLTEQPTDTSRARRLLPVITQRQEGANADVLIPDNLTIEHLMPREWKRYWALPAGASAQARDLAIHTIGNLTLLHGNANASANNSPWPQKRGLLAASGLATNRQLAQLTEWDEAAIRRRSEDLAMIVCQIWPKPRGATGML